MGRCKVCGRKLKKEGNICRNCYEKQKRQENLMADNEEEVFRIKRKYSPKFNLLKNGEMLIILLLVVLAGFSAYNAAIAILIMLLCIVIFGVWMFYNKKRAMGTTTIFYQTKLRYTTKYLFSNDEEVVAYDDIKDVAYFQTKAQRICKVGDIRFYKKDGFLSGLTIYDIPDIEENFNKMKDIINETR